MLEADSGDELFGAVIDSVVAGELAAHIEIDRAFVRLEGGNAVNVSDDKGANFISVGVGNMERTSANVPIDNGNKGLLFGRPAGVGVTSLAASVGLIGFKDFVADAKRAFYLHVRGFAQAMRHEPNRLVCGAKRAIHLVGAETLHCAGDQAELKKPLVQGDFAIFHDGADRDRQGFGAIVKLVNADPRGLARHLHEAVQTTAREGGAVRPT